MSFENMLKMLNATRTDGYEDKFIVRYLNSIYA